MANLDPIQICEHKVQEQTRDNRTMAYGSTECRPRCTSQPRTRRFQHTGKAYKGYLTKLQTIFFYNTFLMKWALEAYLLFLWNVHLKKIKAATFIGKLEH